MKDYRQFTISDEKRLAEWVAEGKSVRWMAEQLHRSSSSISSKLYNMKQNLRPATEHEMDNGSDQQSYQTIASLEMLLDNMHALVAEVIKNGTEQRMKVERKEHAEEIAKLQEELKRTQETTSTIQRTKISQLLKGF
jgi:IS30 family transposase